MTGTLHRFGKDDEMRSTWLGEAGEDPVRVRHSRSIGLPAPLPDVFGLAIRVPLAGDRHGDLLFATTGLGRVTRYTFTVAQSPFGRPMTTLLPYRTAAGSVLLAATFRDEHTVALAWSFASGSWRPFAELILDEDPTGEPDAELSFDPVLNQLPGLEIPGWVRRLREPAYSMARRSRRS